MSERLYFNINKVVFNTLSWAYYHNADNPIRLLTSSELISHKFTPKAVASGCSLGVDSFSVIKRHLFDTNTPEGFRLTHLTFFNVGAIGSDTSDMTKQAYLKEKNRVKIFADKYNLPIVFVDSNINDFYPIKDFNATHTFRNMSVVLAMQKLFKRYLYASTYPLRNIKISKDDLSHFESTLLPLLATESTDIMSADPEMSRSEKIEYIASDPEVQKSLYVCRKEQANADNEPEFRDISMYAENVNCGKCMKCKRTMMALEIIGKLNEYKDTFDFTYWNSGGREQYLLEILLRRKDDEFYQDLYDNIVKNNYTIPQSVLRKYHVIKFLSRYRLLRIYNFVRRYLH